MSSPASTGPSRSRRQPVLIVSGILIVVLVLVSVIGYSLWGWRSAEAAAHVTVVAGPGPIRCDDGELPVRLADERAWPGTIIRLKSEPGGWCQVPISIRNESAHTITVRDLTFPVARANSHAAGPLVVTDDGSLRGATGPQENMDAVFESGETIEPDDFITSLIRVEINPNACQSAGISTLPNVPRVRFSVLHRTHETNGAIHLQAKIGKAGLFGPNCDDE